MKGDQKEIFETIYRDYYGMVLQVCTGFMKGDVMQANDLAQDIFINTWNALPNYRGDSSYKTWIYRITVNTCLQQLRKNKKTRSMPFENIPEQSTEAGVPADNNYSRLYKAVGQLEEIDRLVIMMVLDEMEYGEICKVTGISAVNLRVKIHRIKTRLRKIMDHE